MFSQYIRRLWKDKPKKDLRQTCLEMYGDGFIRQYDAVNMGIPIGNSVETKEFLTKVKAAKIEVKDDKA